MKRVDSKDRFISTSQFISAYKESRKRVFSRIYNKHDGHEILLVLSGQCEVRIEERTYPLKRNNVLFIAEGEFHSIHTTEWCSYLSLFFRPGLVFSNHQLVSLFLRPFLNGRNGGSHKLQVSMNFIKQIKHMYALLTNQKKDIIALTEGTVKLIKYFEKLKLAVPQDRLSRTSIQITPALNLIYRNYHEKLNVNIMAKACALSRRTFYRMFYAAIHKTPIDLLNEIRLEHTANLIATTDQKISVIANSVGFFNLSYFNRVFRKKTGQTPLQYRASA
jgi:AraC-like DNA-binding protein